MTSLQYSSDALKVLPNFHKVERVFYVEGEDDVLFWDLILDNFGIMNYKLKEAGGSKELVKYAEKIIKMNSSIFVLFDCDYSDLIDNQYNHNNIIYTYGYSIENSLYHPKNIKRTIEIYSRTNSIDTKEYKNWLNDFMNSLIDLLILDIASEMYQKGIEILGDNCCRFLKNSNSIKLDVDQIDSFIKTKQRYFTKQELSEVTKILQNTDKKLEFIFRGHFLTNAIMNFIKRRVNTNKKRFNISKDNLFAQLIAQFPYIMEKTEDVEHLQNEINKLAS